MWSGIVSGTFRAWFMVDAGNGTPKTGLLSGNFTAKVIAPNDSASTTATVTASTQSGGVYYFDVPSAFLVTHGAGDYGVSIVILAAGPTFRAVSGNVLKVTVDDIDRVSKTVKPLLSLL